MRIARPLLTIGLLAGPLVAQSPTALPVGTRVKVRTATETGAWNPAVDGFVERLTGDTLLLRPKFGDATSVVFDPVRDQVYVFAGRHSSVLRGTSIGAAVGIVVGGLGFALAGNDCPPERSVCFNRTQTALAGTALVGAIGAASGFLIGIFTSHDSWSRLSVRPTLAFGLRGRGAGVSLSLRMPMGARSDRLR